MKKITALFPIALLLFSGILIADASDWPQWRGPDKDGISRETGLLKEWPDSGPQVLWRVPLGEGFSGMSVVDGRVYTMFSEGDDEFVVCLDASNGSENWRFRSDSNYQESMGGNGKPFVVHLDFGGKADRPDSGVVLNCDVGPTYHCAMYASAYSAEGAIHTGHIGDFEFPWGVVEIVQKIKKMVQARQPQAPYEEMVENIAVATAARRSLAERRRVYLEEVC